jgi:ankyrin repeat protein
MAVKHESSLRWLLEHGADPNMTFDVPSAGSCQQPRTAVACAAKLSDPASLELLFSHGAETDPLAIFHAIGLRSQMNGTATLEVLINHGADVDYVSRHWGTPLHQAVRRSQTAKVKLLLERGADPNIKTLTGRASALEYAKEEGRVEMYELMNAAQSKDEA